MLTDYSQKCSHSLQENETLSTLIFMVVWSVVRKSSSPWFDIWIRTVLTEDCVEHLQYIPGVSVYFNAQETTMKIF